MNSQPDDEFRDGDFENNDDAADFDFSLLTGQLAGELARYLADRWREEEEDKAINVNLSLSTALNRIPVVWLDAACQANHLILRGSPGKQRRARAAALVACLTSRDQLRRCVAELPPRAQAALRRLVASGGWMRLADLTREFGSMDGDGWFWNEEPPTSCLGELRRRALLFIGRTARTKDGKLGQRTFKVAVVPKDLRELLRDVLAEMPTQAEARTTPEEALNDAIGAAHSYYDAMAWPMPLERGDVEDFLRYAVRSGLDPLATWSRLEVFLTFIETRLHEIQSLDDLRGYHVSELVSTFVDATYVRRWTLDERRSLVHLVCRLYDRLHERGRILAETRDEIRSDCARLVGSKRKLDLIHRPPPLGGEPIFVQINPITGERRQLTFNHLRLLLVWAAAFHQDWHAMLQACAQVPSGARKQALVHELSALEPAIRELIISQVDRTDFDRAIRWFYEDALLELSAW
ncbi:MAG: hypothetical protein RML99_09855 [Anaerolineae bacterium]|nr:hypothetical protein [Anaerolineae bacterium]